MRLKLLAGLGVAVCLAGCHVSQEVANEHLYVACLANDLPGVQKALAEGADPNVSRRDNDFPFSPLETAVERPSLVAALLKAGAAPKKRDSQGFLPLGMAAGAGATESVQLILKAGAVLEAKDADGMTALACAAGSGRLENAKFLVSCGANVNTRDRLGFTPLFHSVVGMAVSTVDRTEMVRFLIQHGADVTVQDNKGRTAVTYAKTTFARATGASQTLIDLLSGKAPAQAPVTPQAGP